MGEAVKRLSLDLRSQHPEIPWTLAGMRDHLIHGYDVVDWEEVWNGDARCPGPVEQIGIASAKAMMSEQIPKMKSWGFLNPAIIT
jgi:hypothetical protein